MEIKLATTSIHCDHGALGCIVHLDFDEFTSQNIAPAVQRAARLISSIGPGEEAQYDCGEGSYSEWTFGDWSKQTIEVFNLENEFAQPTPSQVLGVMV